MRKLGTILGMGAMLLVFATAAVGYPTTVVDDRGQEITIESAPQRVVSLNALYTQIIVDLDLADHLVALGESDDNPEAVADLPSVGPAFTPNVELILGQEPDLVLGANDWGGERQALEAAGITVFTTAWLTDMVSIFDTIRAIAATLDAGEAADLLIGRIASDIIEAESTILGLPEVSAAFLYASTAEDAPYAAGGDSIESELILRAGGSNVFSELVWSPQISFEDLLDRNPEVIFTDPSQIENVLANPFMQSLDAVVNGRVYGVSGSDVTSTRVADALLAIIDGLHGTND